MGLRGQGLGGCRDGAGGLSSDPRPYRQNPTDSQLPHPRSSDGEVAGPAFLLSVADLLAPYGSLPGVRGHQLRRQLPSQAAVIMPSEEATGRHWKKLLMTVC